jgi:DNA-binding beta-propeller fold protein YncE
VHAEEQYQYVTQWGSEFTSPKNIDVDTTGNVYVLDKGDFSGRVQKFNADGGFISQWYSYQWATGLAVDSAGNIFVSEIEGARVLKFEPDGTEITRWGGFGQDNGKFGIPYCVAVDTSGNVYVGDTSWVIHSRIQKFDSDGGYSGKWDAGAGEDSVLPDLAVDTAGNVYVLEEGVAAIQKFSSGGSLLKEWGSQGSGDGQFDYPSGVAVDTAGNVYVADTGNNRVQKFTSEGTFITKWGSSGMGNGEFDGPAKLAVDSAGNVYVLDIWNSRVQKFAKVELPTPLIFDAKCPVDISITDPEGHTISKLVNEIAGASYSETGMGSDNRLDVQVIIPDKKPGKYVITATARDLVSPTETFSLDITSGGVTQIIVKNFPVGSIGGKDFGIEVSSDGVITISGSGGIPSPEFPSIALPVTMIIGFLGAVLLIQRTREH